MTFSPNSTLHVVSNRPIPSPKRPCDHIASPDGEGSENRRKDSKVSRACDACKAKKIRCSGTLPCSTCSRRRLSCTFASRYGRGRPPTPPSSTTQQHSPSESTPQDQDLATSHALSSSHSLALAETTEEEAPTPRATSELVIEGQYFDLTSGLTFLHRAWSKLSAQGGHAVPYGSNEAERNQLLASAGDRPFCLGSSRSEVFPDDEVARRLLAFYFDTCVVTYRMLHRQTGYPNTLSVGDSRVATILTIFAIARLRTLKVQNGSSSDIEPRALRDSDTLFYAATELTDSEMGFPRLESAQARLIQVLYLLQTARMNKASYTFGNAYQIISSLGLHRRQSRQANASLGDRSDYIAHQCAKRVFWTAYTMDKYLSVVLGRPRLMHDDEIDQDFPDTVNDEDMGPHGPLVSEANEESHIISLIFHAKIAKIIGQISREVYCIGTGQNAHQAAAAHRLVRELHAWHSDLPPHLGTVKPSTLIPSFRREATALDLAYLHALIHATRPSLLGSGSNANEPEAPDRVTECLSAAKKTLELVNNMANDDYLFHSFWWTQYVLFCALAVVYVWEIQQNANSSVHQQSSHPSLYDLAESCRVRLLQGNSAAPPSHRYGLILEELRSEAQQQASRHSHPLPQCPQEQNAPFCHGNETGLLNEAQLAVPPTDFVVPTSSALHTGSSMLDGWQTTDWLDLDSSRATNYGYHMLEDIDTLK
ncbi:fungal-specific transcription factor domain-containing protein [Aspergillus aurantiobrunneus]